MTKNKNIALVLSGGGARGIAHIGVLEELDAMGYHINSIAGTSMGALIGGLYATGKLEDFKEWVLKLNRYNTFRLLDFSLKSGGFIKGEKVVNLLKTVIPDQEITEMKIPFCCAATDLQSQKSIRISTGKLYDAIHASIAIPGIFAPVKKGEMLLVDGGVLNNIPTNFAIKTKPEDQILAVNVNAFTKFEHKESSGRSFKLNFFKNSNRAVSLMMETIGQFNLKEHPADLMINISRYSCELYEFYKAEQQIEYGRQCARKLLDMI